MLEHLINKIAEWWPKANAFIDQYVGRWLETELWATVFYGWFDIGIASFFLVLFGGWMFAAIQLIKLMRYNDDDYHNNIEFWTFIVGIGAIVVAFPAICLLFGVLLNPWAWVAVNDPASYLIHLQVK